MARDLTSLLFPRSVAVIGASDRPDSLAGAVLRNLVRGGFVGRLVAVHPNPGTFPGADSAASLEALSEVPDLAVWGVSGEVVDRELPRLLDRGTRAHIVMSAGYAETGDAGAERERALVARVRARGGVLQGPNCMGLHVAGPRGRLDASFSRTGPEPGASALLVQSGSVSEWLLVRMRTRRLGAALAVSAGNMGDLDLVDYLDAVPRHFPEVRQVFLYIETMPEADRLRRVMAGLPEDLRVIALRGGTTGAGARAVAGHTGALADPPALVDALLSSVGIRQVRSLTHALDSLEVLDRLESPRGRRAAVLTNAGGPGILAADALTDQGFSLPGPSPELAGVLRDTLPAATGNPVDMLATATPAQFRQCLEHLATAPEFDVLVPLFMHPVTVDAQGIAEAMIQGLGARRAHAVVCWIAGDEAESALATLRAARVAAVPEPRRLAEALGTWADCAPRKGVPWPEAVPARPLPGPRDPGSAAESDSGWGDPAELEIALESPLHRVPGLLRVRAVDDVPSAAQRVGYPLLLKVESDTQPHKQTSGLLQAVETAAELMPRLESLRSVAPPGARWLVQQRVRASLEVYVGFLRHPRLGSFLGFGPGGTGMEFRTRVAWISLPATEGDFPAALRANPLGAVLGGTGPHGGVAGSGSPGPGAASALASLAESLARIGLASTHVTMAEVNPAIWDAECGWYWMVDCRWMASAASG